MLGPIARQYMFKGYEMGNILFHLPYKWNKTEKKVLPSDSVVRKCAMYFNLCEGAFGLSYCGVLTAYMYILKEDDPQYLPFYMMGMVMTLSLIFPVALQFNIIRTRNEMINFNYIFIDYATYFQDMYVLPDELKRQSSKKCDESGIFFASLYYLGLTIVILIGLIILLYPRLPLLLTGNFDFWHWTIYWTFHIIQSIGITLYCATWFGNQFVHAFPGLEYVFGVLYMLKELKLRSKNQTTFDNLRRPEEFVRNYKAIQILHAKIMYLNGGIVLPVNQWVYMFTATYCIYGAVKLEGLFSLVMVVASFILIYYLAIAFTMFARIHDTSVEVLESWRRQKQDPWVRKTLETFKPINVLVGDYYYCDHLMVITMFQSILEGTVDLLMLSG